MPLRTACGCDRRSGSSSWPQRWSGATVSPFILASAQTRPRSVPRSAVAAAAAPPPLADQEGVSPAALAGMLPQVCAVARCRADYSADTAYSGRARNRGPWARVRLPLASRRTLSESRDTRLERTPSRSACLRTTFRLFPEDHLSLSASDSLRSTKCGQATREHRPTSVPLCRSPKVRNGICPISRHRPNRDQT